MAGFAVVCKLAGTANVLPARPWCGFGVGLMQLNTVLAQ